MPVAGRAPIAPAPSRPFNRASDVRLRAPVARRNRREEQRPGDDQDPVEIDPDISAGPAGVEVGEPGR